MSLYDNETTQNNDHFVGLRVTNEMKRNWLTTSKWARFFAILGFVVSGLYLLFLGSFSAIMESMNNLTGGNPVLTMMMPLMTYFTVFIALILLVQLAYHYYHLRFANDMKNALNLTNQSAFEQSWKNLRNHFRIFGIMMIAVMVLYVVMIAVVVSTVGAAASSGGFPGE